MENVPKTRVVTDLKTGEKSLKLDKRTISKVNNPPHVKTLRYSRKLPPECNMCPYRPQEEGGESEFNCTKYKKDSVCIIRKDFEKLVDKFDGMRDSDRVLAFMQSEFENNFENLMFFESMESQTGAIDPEVTKRINALNNLGKSLTEMRTKRESVEVTKSETLTDDMKREITETVKLTRDSFES